MESSNELRLGNFVNNYSPAKPVKIPLTITYTVAAVYWGHVHLIMGNLYNPSNGFNPFEEHVANLIPIKLTEEWLLRLGFQKRYDKRKIYEIDDENFPFVIDCFNERFMVFCNNECQLEDIKYVHQLQNLAFVLTGKDLKYEE